MFAPGPNSRRQFLKSAASAAGFAALARPLGALAQDQSRVVEAARAGLARVGARATSRDVVAVADFARPSREPRLSLVDMATGRAQTLLVAHGRGSDPARTGWLKSFSNAPDSDATSQGDYLIGAPYVGKHGRSLRLVGLDPTNCNAEARGIVVHSAWYVGPQVVQAQGMLGRSEGCFALSEADLAIVLQRLGPGHVLVSTKL